MLGIKIMVFFSLVPVYLLPRCTPVLKAGAKLGSSPADVVQACDIIFACVSDPNAVRDVSQQHVPI